mgnify:CR=1 FL=1
MTHPHDAPPPCPGGTCSLSGATSDPSEGGAYLFEGDGVSGLVSSTQDAEASMQDAADTTEVGQAVGEWARQSPRVDIFFRSPVTKWTPR